MLAIKRNKILLIIISIIIVSLFGVASTLVLNKSINLKKSYALKLIGIIEKDEESLLTKEELEDYEIKINQELEKELNEKKDKFKIKSAYYALGAIEFVKGENYKSIDYLYEALKYNNYKDVKDTEYEVDIRIYSGLSSNYIKLKKAEEASVFFEEAKKIALNNNKREVLSDLYYAKAKANVISGHNINASINLMIKALDYTELDSNKVRDYLYLATLYKLTNEFHLALDYTVNALEIAMELRDDTLINDCLINLGENYYIKRNYAKTITIYEQFIDEYGLENTNNIIDVYGYLAYCYAKKGDYTNYEMYKEKYLNIANESNSIEDLIWLYSNCVELEADFNNLDIAKEYLNKAQDLYENHSDE
ncbi:hypothetical protein H9660_09465 [Clostridium sp. Sa3CUN1]|uniref:TPR repeat-containing protein n=1 Tax=Clostridium gallinarum TaxID=2762246 RepID=A0ABR8Q4P8_9CLOT|nr:hypothetical protein [Clostridium gallinarum]MBD7915375.1 hypothetical protein [Clostridium gallinarum]